MRCDNKMKTRLNFVSLCLIPILSVFILSSCSLTRNAKTIAFQFPQPTDYVNDFAGILRDDEKKELSKIITAFEKRTGLRVKPRL